MKLTRGAWNVRSVVLWALLVMLVLAVSYAVELGPVLGLALVLGTGVAHDLLARWMLGPPPPKDTPP